MGQTNIHKPPGHSDKHRQGSDKGATLQSHYTFSDPPLAASSPQGRVQSLFTHTPVPTWKYIHLLVRAPHSTQCHKTANLK